MEHVMEKFNQFSKWVMNLFILQLFWLLGALLGGIILGIIPSTIALYASIRQLYLKNDTFNLLTYFKKTYQENFLKSMVIGIWYGIGIIIGYIYLVFLNNTIHSWLAYTHLFIYFLLFVITLVLLFMIPVYVHYEIPFKKLISSTFFIVVVNTKWLIPLLFSLTALLLIFIRFSVVFLFYGVSLSAFVILYFSMKMFEAYDLKRVRYEEIH